MTRMFMRAQMLSIELSFKYVEIIIAVYMYIHIYIISTSVCGPMCSLP